MPAAAALLLVAMPDFFVRPRLHRGLAAGAGAALRAACGCCARWHAASPGILRWRDASALRIALSGLYRRTRRQAHAAVAGLALTLLVASTLVVHACC